MDRQERRASNELGSREAPVARLMFEEVERRTSSSRAAAVLRSLSADHLVILNRNDDVGREALPGEKKSDSSPESRKAEREELVNDASDSDAASES